MKDLKTRARDYFNPAKNESRGPSGAEQLINELLAEIDRVEQYVTSLEAFVVATKALIDDFAASAGVEEA